MDEEKQLSRNEMLAKREEQRRASENASSALGEMFEGPSRSTSTKTGSSTSSTAPPSRRADFDQIVESVYRLDIRAEYDSLERELVVRDNEGDRGTLRSYLNRAEDNARRAHRLYLAAKIEAERTELDEQPLIGAMRREANDRLQREKDAGKRSKAITDADVSTLAASMYPNDWPKIHERIAKAKGTAEHLERFADLWRSRCGTARSLLESSR